MPSQIHLPMNQHYSTSEPYEGYWSHPNSLPVAHHAAPGSCVTQICHPYTSMDSLPGASVAFQGTRYTCVDGMYYREEIDLQHGELDLSSHQYQVNVANINAPTTVSSSLPLHAPVPLPGQPALLSCADLETPEYSAFLPPPQPSYQDTPCVDYSADDAYSRASSESHPLSLNYQYIPTGEPIQGTFPTPSELLVELSARDAAVNADSLVFDGGPETARKARRRATAKSVGFIPTDPDSITSHEKKRHYLECLEQYITYLHQQLSIIGAQPAQLERVSEYRGLTSRSIRTLLVHMENTTRKLNLRTLSEEHKFLDLRDAVRRLEDAAQGSAT